MQIGVPKEIKDSENRVGMTPEGVEALTDDGHDVLIEEGAGAGVDIPDTAYEEAGAEVVDQDAAWDTDLTVKIKEPLEQEYDLLDEDTTLFTYLHLAADEGLTEEIVDSGMTAIAYETVEDDGDLPLLQPMSEVAGRMAPLMGAYHQSKHEGGAGILPPGVSDSDPGQITVVGGGTVGANAAEVASGMGADVTVFEKDRDRMTELDEELDAAIEYSEHEAIQDALPDTDVLVGAVLVSGAQAPTVVSEDDVELMDEGSVVVDVAVDQGGCVETTRATSHSDPTYEHEGVVHYAVDNMPGAYPKTATDGITSATLPYIRDIADKGWTEALADDPTLRKGLNAADGELTYGPVAEAFDMEYTDPEDLYDDLA